MLELDRFATLGIALGLGLLVGLERERNGDPVAGIRTFALIALFGALCGLPTPDSGTPGCCAGSWANAGECDPRRTC
jgi:uncharacterized membrane protein YhiD involved in acid resistance